MNKKVLTVLLLAVFVLAQFSIASAATVDGSTSITSIPDFSSGASADVDWTVTGMAAGSKNVLIWSREYAPAPATYALADCQLIATINGISDASGTYSFNFAATTLALSTGDQVEFTLTVDDSLCATATIPAIDSVMGSTYIDRDGPHYLVANPPSTSLLAPSLQNAACNTFEYWALGGDDDLSLVDLPYSGFGKWNPSVTGTFAPPVPLGPADDLFSWIFTFPETASGVWTATIYPEDMVENKDLAAVAFRKAVVVNAAETTNCETFSDISGHEDEEYVRYLATLGLINGFADGSFGPDNTLSRAEAAALIEISNGYDETSLPASAPAGCDFTDVAASNWFAGWVWQACDDGLMNGVGGGLFDPNNLLTRGQIVTILNNVSESYLATPALFGGYISTANTLLFLYLVPPFTAGYGFRHNAWADVSVGAYYAVPVQKAYGWGVAEGTSETTFSPDQPVTRGEFAKMLYRALSRFL